MSLGLPDDVAELVTFDEVRSRRGEFSGSELVQGAEGERQRQGDDRSVSASGRLEPRRDAPERLIVTERAGRPAAHREPSQHRLVVAMIGFQRVERLRQPLLSCVGVALDDCDVSVQEQIADRRRHARRERALAGYGSDVGHALARQAQCCQECGPRRARRAASRAPLECRTVRTSSRRPAGARPCRRPRRSCSGCCLRGGWLVARWWGSVMSSANSSSTRCERTRNPAIRCRSAAARARSARVARSGVNSAERVKKVADAAQPPRSRARSAAWCSSAATASSASAVAAPRCQARRSRSPRAPLASARTRWARRRSMIEAPL